MLQDSAKTKAYSIEKLPMGRFVWWVTILSSMGMFMDGYVLTIFSAATILPIGLKSVFQPTSLEWGLMGAASLLGMFVGAATFGNLADRIGRKRLYIYDLAWLLQRSKRFHHFLFLSYRYFSMSAHYKPV